MPTNDSVHVARFKAKAKALHRAVKASDETALARIRPYFEDPKDFKLSDAHLVVARELRLPSWKQLTAKQDWANCSFCSKWQYDVSTLIAGPNGVFVCDECVDLCIDIIREQKAG
jgi:hypothetical protein